MERTDFNPDVDTYLNNALRWQEEMKQLRKIILDCRLKEEVKWNKPCYTFNGKNIVLIQDFKKYCALLFFKGFLIDDTKGVLVKTGKNTYIGRQIRFHSIQEIHEKENILKAYIRKAIQIEIR